MTERRLTDQSFAALLNNAVDITETFDIDLGNLPEDVLRATQEAQPFVKAARERMELRPLSISADLTTLDSGLLDMSEWADAYSQQVKDAYTAGNVIAVDGTPIVAHKRFLTQQIFACAIGGLTSRNPMQLMAKQVKTQSDLKIDENLSRVVDESSALSQSHSWPTAFMEYQERLFALESAAQYVLVDGSLLPQNLITRTEGRHLFNAMLLASERKIYVGVMKNISEGDSERRWIARALRTGEMFVHETLAQHFDRNERREAYDQTVGGFLDTVGVNILRGVFKPGRKPFGFECHRDDLGLVVALLWLDRDNIPGHEIPFLLNQVDAQLRGRYRPSETMAAIEAQLVHSGEDEFFDELDERTLR